MPEGQDPNGSSSGDGGTGSPSGDSGQQQSQQSGGGQTLNQQQQGRQSQADSSQQQQSGQQDGQTQTAQRVEDLPDWAQKMVRDLRGEAANNRTAKTAAEQQNQEMLDGIARALGLKKGEEPPDPAKLQQSLTEREQKISTLEEANRLNTIELAAWRSAALQGANTAALLDSRSFVDAVAKLDPAADTFQAQLDAAVKKAVDDNPAMRAAAPPADPARAGIGVGSTSEPAAGSTSPGIGTLRQGYAEVSARTRS